MKNITVNNISRRGFLKTTGLATGGLLLQGCFLSSDKKDGSKAIPLNAYIRITEDNFVTLIVHQAEMGQGAQTTLPAILADELGADWSSVILENGLTDPAFQNPKFKFQFTGNAESIRSFHDILRKTAATARELLKEAAAEAWGVDVGSLVAKDSHILDQKNGKKAPFGDFVVRAGTLQAPENPKIKARSEWTLVGGKSLPRVDVPDKVTGKAIFGIDVALEGLLHAAVTICPYFGGTIKELHENDLRNMPGFIDLVRIPVANPIVAYPPGFTKQEGIAVVAESYWQARMALKKLQIVYEPGPNAALDSESLYSLYEDTLQGSEWHESLKEGDAQKTIHTSNDRHTATYYSAWQSHATMEPMNATAEFKEDRIEIWAPTQGQEMAQILLSKEFGVPQENIIVNRTYLGGGFGRRLLADYIYLAAYVSKQVKRPVKLIWSREEDMQHDYYRPGTMQSLTASLDTKGMPTALHAKAISPTILQAATGADYVFEGEDPSFPEGIKETPYRFENFLLDVNMIRLPIQTSVWRSTGFGPNVFALESFIDELAAKNGKDPIPFRKELITEERSASILDAVAEASGWYKPKKEGHYMGVALTHSFETFAAQIIELSIDGYGILDIHKITTAVDCGIALDPAICRASIESGITWGLTQALSSEITFKNGRTVESNFHDFKILTPAEFKMELETIFVDSGAKIGGIAESGPIPVAPALCNAIFAATGKRFRTLPLKKHGIYTRYASNYLPKKEKLTKKFAAL